MVSLFDKVKQPFPYETGASLWTHPHIAGEMLKSHLDPDFDGASLRPEKIDRICTFLWEQMALAPGGTLADLGCGPGLYAERMAKRGAKVWGVDISESSIAYARKSAASKNLGIFMTIALLLIGTGLMPLCWSMRTMACLARKIGLACLGMCLNPCGQEGSSRWMSWAKGGGIPSMKTLPGMPPAQVFGGPIPMLFLIKPYVTLMLWPIAICMWWCAVRKSRPTRSIIPFSRPSVSPKNLPPQGFRWLGCMPTSWAAFFRAAKQTNWV